MSSASTEHLKRMVSSGVVEFIFEAEQSISLIKACGSSHDFLRKHIFGELFGTIQALAITQFVLSVTKIYEKPHKHYQNLSLPSVLEYVQQNADQLNLLDPQLVFRKWKQLKITTEKFDVGDVQAKTNREIVSCLQKMIPNVESDKALQALKTLRDKKIAHPEDIDLATIEKTTWEQAEMLLVLCRYIVGIIGDAYLNIPYCFLVKSDHHIQRYTTLTTMQIKLFTILVNDSGAAQQELNTFLKGHTIQEMEQKKVSNNNGACWYFCVRYLDTPFIAASESKYKVDYRQVLDEPTFQKFSNRRAIRKQAA